MACQAHGVRSGQCVEDTNGTGPTSSLYARSDASYSCSCISQAMTMVDGHLQSVASCVVELRAVLHQSHMLSCEMMHFVQGIQYYLSFEVWFTELFCNLISIVAFNKSSDWYFDLWCEIWLVRCWSVRGTNLYSRWRKQKTSIMSSQRTKCFWTLFSHALSSIHSLWSVFSCLWSLKSCVRSEISSNVV